MKKFFAFLLMVFCMDASIVYAAETAATKVAQAAQTVATAASSPDMLDRVAGYLQKFYAAALPVAKQAYEIGLTVLRIDAVGVLLPGIGLVCLSLYLSRKLTRHVQVYQAKADDWNKQVIELLKQRAGVNTAYFDPDRYNPRTWLAYQTSFDHGGYNLTRFVVWIPAMVSLLWLADIWNWCKLIAPDVWLAHVAIAKIIG